jgi:translation initiation factor 5A
VILIEGGPCKVTKKTSAKSGKHGAAKQLFTADNVFTGKRFQLNVTGGSKWTRVHSTKKEYEIMDMDTKEGTITCMGEGDDCEELTFNYDKFGQQEGDKLKESFDDGKLCIAQTLKSYTQKKEVRACVWMCGCFK